VRRRDLAAARRELRRGLHRVQARLAEQVPEPLRTGHPRGAGLFLLIDLPLDFREPVAAVPGAVDPKLSFPLPQALERRVETVALDSKPGPFRRKLVEQPVEELGLGVREVIFQRLALRVERADLGIHRVVGVAVLQQRGESGELRLGALHRFVRLGEILEVGDDVRGCLRRVERLEHVVADEIAVSVPCCVGFRSAKRKIRSSRTDRGDSLR
jgi:hypothetical protein